jgi:hypothetical protein
MFSWLSSSIQKINFENVQSLLETPEKMHLINTLPSHQQNCLIFGTLDVEKEESTVNDMLNNLKVPERYIVVYGKNEQDETAINKAQQLLQLGVKDVFLYSGGLFEWLLLQDIYGSQNFPTTSVELDILRYKSPRKSFH